MKLDITIKDNGNYDVDFHGKTFSGGVLNASAHGAMHEIKRMIDDDAEDCRSIKDRIIDELNAIEVGESCKLSTFDKEIKDYRVRLSIISKEIGLKFKTKIIDGKLFAERIK